MGDTLLTNNSQHDVATYDVVIDGKALAASIQLLSLSVMKECNRIPVARMVFRDGESSEKNFSLSNNASFEPGKKVTIKIGRDTKNTQVFQGIITMHAVKIKTNGNSELHIECRDEAVKMTVGRHSKYYQQLTDSDLFSQLITKYGLTADAESTTLSHKEIVQHHTGDWDFLLMRAEANGMLVNVSDGTVKVSKPKTGANPVLNLTFGASIIEFEAEMDARNQWKSVKSVSWDYKNQQLFTADSSSTSLAEPGNIPGNTLADALKVDYEMHHSGHLLQQELQAWADGAFMRSRLSKIRGRAKVDGFGGVKPGDIVKLDGLGKRFTGNAYVTAVRHDVGGGLWETQVQFGLSNEYHAQQHKDVNPLPNEGVIGEISGLHVGKVVQLESDPDGEDRILIKLPTIDKDAKGIWTRVAAMDAGDSRGSFFLPELEDEVIVGFINNDPRHAVMLGMLHSSAKPAPIKAEDANDKKGITTRSKMHISFDDKTKTITIDTPAGNSIILDEANSKIEIKDQSSNKVTMDTSGIKVESPLKIEIKAGSNLDISAAAKLSIKAASISIEADADVSVQGAIAKLSSQGITEVTGSIVKIN